ncbi:MAG: hypothetical protein KDK28_10350 [Maritimibacter sp.]|nr:hypothetical protein [Maritimibacter sp.]
MLRLALLLLTLAAPAAAQTPACPAEPHGTVEAAARAIEAGTGTLDEINTTATALVRGCAGDRALYGHILAAFTRAGLAVPPPDRFAAHQNALKTVGVVLKAGGDAFADVAYALDGEAVAWTMLDERNAYFDLILALSTDYLVHGVHAALYTPGTAESFGCGLYPDEEAAALALQAEDNADGGELVVRLGFLGRNCDLGTGEVAGQAARYFAAHYRARRDDPDYLGLTASDIRGGLQRFLADHFDGSGPSRLFSDAERAELLAF